MTDTEKQLLLSQLAVERKKREYAKRQLDAEQCKNAFTAEDAQKRKITRLICATCGYATVDPTAKISRYCPLCEFRKLLAAERERVHRAEAELARLQEALGAKTVANSDIACTAESMGQRVPMTGHVTTEETP